MTSTRTTCAYCGVGCGILATPGPDRAVQIAGDPEHPANRGKLCSKGTHLGETVGLEGRLLHPMIGRERASWDEALDLVANEFRAVIAEHGPDSVAFYVSGQILTEDYYAANKLMKGFIGSGNIDTNSRLCMSSAVAAHIRAFGEDVVPASYDDIDAADLIILVGSNTAWCHPVVWQRIEAARAARGTKLVVIDPRRTETAEGANLHLPLRPGTDVALFNGLLARMRDRQLLDRQYLDEYVQTPDGFWSHLSADVAEICDLDPVALDRFYELFAQNPRTVTLFSQGVNQSVQGTDKANAIINVHLATGRIGKPGAAPFSITGQPNAMGGREVGGLASTLAAHMDFATDNVDRVGRFWNAPAMASKPGLKAVDLFRAVGEGKIKALWIMATNPAVSMPDAGAVRAALATCPFVVVSDVIADTDTTRFAHVRLPGAAWGEKDGTVTNSDRTISRQRRFLPLPGDVRADWWAMAEVGRRMGFAEAFDWDGPAAVFREHAALTAFENDGARKLDLGEVQTIDDAGYDAMAPFVWGGTPFADGLYSHADGKARLIAVRQLPLDDAPMILNTGRYRDQWHTMTRTGLSPKLSQHRREPLIEMEPEDGYWHGLVDGDLARVTTPQGTSIFRVAFTPGQRRGDVFVPIHWTDRTASGGRAGLLPGDAVDPISGQPGFKLTSARIDKVSPKWRGFLIARGAPVEDPDCLWWAKIRVAGGWLIELAGDGDPAELRTLMPAGHEVEMADPVRGTFRAAVVTDDHVQAALFTATDGRLPPRDWLIAQLAEAEAANPAALLAGRPAQALPDRGPIICACFDIGLNTIVEAIGNQALTSVAEVGAAIRAGTNCGSCRPAIAKLIPHKELLDAAE
ncbi:assimilatory nitrate reductase (NADH) alpha subunit apoprotein [Sphingomonas sp. YR710]|uniref:nitrate reductase n=1 Tax=Sphingomonas sp. YR710 TaxID=1882773 RepID=UPI000887A5BE|nr:nitrate reductase [Sphingomonas sp. YR710]SDD05932.1 assimilatory nitrate reductase (NADH) alpha subunit apoprotein [Sphingomonas sp. YR710]